MTKVPDIGSVWLHEDGGLYVVYDVGNKLSGRPRFPTRVHYIDLLGNTFDRDLNEWHERYTELPLMNEDELELRTAAKAVLAAKEVLHYHFAIAARSLRGRATQS